MRKKRFDALITAGIEGHIANFLQQDNDAARIESNKRALTYINYMCNSQKCDPEHYKKLYLGSIGGD